MCWPLFRLELTSGGIGLGSGFRYGVCWPLFRLELCSAHSEILNASIISTIMSSIISFFGLLILALCRLLILPSCRLRLHSLLSICRLWCTFCIGLGLFAFWNCLFFCSCWLELALFRLGWCALCRLSPPWFRRFWRFWSVLAFASCPALPWSRLKASSCPLLPFHRHGLLLPPVNFSFHFFVLTIGNPIIRLQMPWYRLTPLNQPSPFKPSFG